MKLKKNKNHLFPLPLTILLSSCNSALLNPNGEIAIEQRSLILTAFGLMLIVVIPTIFLTLLFSWRYKASNTKIEYKPEWSHSKKIETVIWIVPILIILFLSILTWKTTHSLEPSHKLPYKTKPINIDVISLDWKWLFIYPELRIATINEIAFPINTPVIFKITSNSVMNSFFIPTLGSQIYSMAGMQTKLNLIANKVGVFNGISSNFSGRGFSGMKFHAIATKNKTEFYKWITKVKNSSNKLYTMNDFEKIASPTENNPIKYFSTVNPELFLKIINKFTTCKNMHHHKIIDTNQQNSKKTKE